MRVSIHRPSVNLLVALLIVSLLGGVTCLSSGCATSAVSVQTPPGMGDGDNQNNRSHAPALYALFDDKSGSVNSARLTPVQEQDLLRLIDILRQTGGELAFGLIGESSNRPLVRLRIPSPPPAPVKRDAQNPFERAEQDAAFQSEVDDYNTKHQFWERDVNQCINVFLSAVRPRLQQPAHEKATDISSALERAELFLNEPDDAWPAETAPHKYIILNSDGIATVNRKTVEIRSGARLLLINGIGSSGIFASLHPLQFESKEAAFDFLKTTELGRDK